MALCHGGLLGPGMRGQIFINGRDKADLRFYELCTAEATCTVATGCVHEHIQRAPACLACAQAAIAAANSGKHAICYPCMRADCLDCTVLVVIEQPQEVPA